MKRNYLFLLIPFFIACSTRKDTGELSFFEQQPSEIKPAFELLPLGSVMPAGWIKEQMDDQIESGFCRYLDELSPMIMKDQIWGKQRRSASRPDEKNMPDVGFDAKDLQWWNGESQGNWFDGFFRTAVLTQNARALAKTDSIVNYLLSTQDEDGYMGVYDTSLRFKNTEGNGELWTQAVALRALLGYYEYSKNEKILSAVEKAVKRTMTAYNEQAMNPFEGKSTGGIPHGLMFADVTEALYRYTHNTVYRDYTAWLYKAFSSAKPEDNDIHYSFLKDSSKNFIGHSAHTFEHLRVLLYAYYFTGHGELAKALSNYYFKMEKVMLPGGVPFGFENMWGLLANPDSTAAEYCDMVEYELSMIRDLQLTGERSYGDRIEKAFFNSMQGARFPDNKAIVYDKTDNCYFLDMKNPGYNKAKGIGYSEYETRYKYSPTQEDVAVCCVPNACKSYPYYVSHMWMKSSDGLAATIYGPCVLNTEINGTKITIVEKTSYPFYENIEFQVSAEKETEFCIRLRIPEWSVSTVVNSVEAKTKTENGYYVITRRWNKCDTFSISFQSEIKAAKAFDGSVSLSKGPLVYALDIPSVDKHTRTYNVPGFFDHSHTALSNEYLVARFPEENAAFSFTFTGIDGSMENPWAKPVVALKGKMLFGNDTKDVQLIPMGCTLLRRVTFK